MDFTSFVNAYQENKPDDNTELLSCADFSSFHDTPDPSIKLKKEEVLTRITALLTLWAQTILYSMEIPRKTADRQHMMLRTFGSYNFGDYGSLDTDIDILCVTSAYISRNNFFNDLCNLFLNMNEVTDFLVVTGAHIPVMKMRFAGAALDLVFAQLTTHTISPKLNLCDDKVYNNMDSKSFASITGYRVTQKILQLVPNVSNFCSTLRVVKAWAKRRDLYANIAGFLGGASWSILVAKVCQLFPNDNPPTLLWKFFQLYSMWDWSVPVLMENSGSKPEVVEDPMQIVTPVFPFTNTSHNVSRSTRTILVEEFIRVMSFMLTFKCSAVFWNCMFVEETNFFRRYPYYIQIGVIGKNQTTHRKWEGWIKSRLPQFTQMLEFNHMILVHPNSHSFVISCEDTIKSALFVGLSTAIPCYDYSVGMATRFVSLVCAWKEYDGSSMGVEADCIRIEDLPSFAVKAPAANRVNQVAVSINPVTSCRLKLHQETKDNYQICQ